MRLMLKTFALFALSTMPMLAHNDAEKLAKKIKEAEDITETVRKSIVREYIVLRSPEGDVVLWPAWIIPIIRTYSLSSGSVTNSVHRLVSPYSNWKYTITIDRESYLHMKNGTGKRVTNTNKKSKSR